MMESSFSEKCSSFENCYPAVCEITIIGLEEQLNTHLEFNYDDSSKAIFEYNRSDWKLKLNVVFHGILYDLIM